MAQALNCNRCNAFVSFVPSENRKPEESPAAGWVWLRTESGVGDCGYENGMQRRHLCPECVAALEQFMLNKRIEPALHCGTMKMNVELFQELLDGCIPSVTRQRKL